MFILPCLKVVYPSLNRLFAANFSECLQLLNILEIVIRHAHGYNLSNLVKSGNNIHFSLNGICLNNRHDLTVREHAMDINPSD
jgi:hypothetical protein